MLAPSSEGAFYCLRFHASNTGSFLLPICPLPQWCLCSWEYRRLPARAVALSLWKGRAAGAADSLGSGADGQPAAVPPSRQGLKARQRAYGCRSGASEILLGTVASENGAGERRYPAYRMQTQIPAGRPEVPDVGAVYRPSSCAGTRQRAGEGQKGTWAGGHSAAWGSQAAIPFTQGWDVRKGADCTGGNAAGGRLGKVADREDGFIQALAELGAPQ